MILCLADLAEVGLGEPGEDDGEKAEEEGEDGGEKEAPPLPLHQTLLVVDQRDALATVCVTTLHTLCYGCYLHRGRRSQYCPPSSS